MSRAFSVHADQLSAANAGALREQIATETQSAGQTESILRSIERYGSDRSIRRFEVTPTEDRPGSRNTRAATWTVHAVRYDAWSGSF